MSARETHSCFGMEKNSTDLGICKTLWRKNWFLLESPVVSVDPSCHQDPLLVVQSESEQVLDAIATRFWKQLYVCSSYVCFLFQHVISLTFQDRYSTAMYDICKRREKVRSDMRWVGNRKCKIKGGGHVSSTHFCSPPIKKLHCVGNLKPDLKFWKGSKILWKVKRLEEIYLL